MKPMFQVIIHVILTLTFIVCQKDGDEGRPYEFGFTIEGQQHRHEKKDENGIIQGEFGFITADGIYHVTVYATDENGNFKILSMKNIRISAPLDGSPATGPISPEASKYLKSPNKPEQPNTQSSIQSQPQQFQRLEQQPNLSSSLISITTPKPKPVFTTKPTIKPACGGCGYVTTSKTTTSGPLIANDMIRQSNSIDRTLPQSSVFPSQYPSGIPPQYPSGESLQSPTVSNQPPADVEVLPADFQSGKFIPSTGSQQSKQIPTSNQYQQQTSQIQDTRNQPETIFVNQNSQQYSSPVGNKQNSDLFVPRRTDQTSDNPRDHLPSLVDQTSPIQVPTSNQYREQNSQIQDTRNQKETIFEKQNSQSSLPVSNKQNSDLFVPSRGDQISDAPRDQLASLGNQTNQKEYVEILANLPETGIIPNSAGRSGKLNAPPATIVTSRLPPITIADNSIHVGGNNPQDIPIQDKFPGMENGLPDGVEEKDITNILYKFKYTVGFHGHYEKGLKDGTKIGGYFVNGRDGFSRVVTYVADENGYRPKFKLINLGLDSPETPKEDSEKTFGLKSFEFIWYPIE